MSPNGHTTPRSTTSPASINEDSVIAHFLSELAPLQSSYEEPGLDRFEAEGKAEIAKTLKAAITLGTPIDLVLPGFPFKSPNSNEKVLGRLPDRGEEIALERLEKLAVAVEQAYPPGCHVTIFSDGRVFNDLLGVPLEDIQAYKRELREMVKDAGHTHIRFDGLENHAKSNNPIQEISQRFGVHGLDMDTRINADAGLMQTYRSFRKFLKKDLAPQWATMSSSAASKRMGEIAKSMMARNVAFSTLVEHVYSNAIRLSIHLYNNAGPKFGVHLIPQAKHGIPRTPWHSVICEDLDGTIHTTDLGSVDKTKYELVFKRGRAWGFKEKEQDLYAAWEPLNVDFIHNPLHLVIKARVPKDAGESYSPPTLMDVPVESLRALICKHGVVSVQGFHQHTSEELEKASIRIGEVMYWPWGSAFEIKPIVDTKLTGQTLEAMPMHYDGMFKKKHPDSTELGDVPLYQLFHCVEAYPTDPDTKPEESGLTLFAHAYPIIEDLTEEEHERLREITLVYNSGIFDYHAFTHVSPVIVKHQVTGKEILRYHEPWGLEKTKMLPTTVRSQGFEPSEGKVDEVAKYVEKLLVPKLYDPKYCYAHAWTKGEYVFSDNVSLIHSRTAMKADGRHVRRIHIN